MAELDLFDLEVAMDLGWIVTPASPDDPTAQISLSEGEPGVATDHPVLTIEVGDVDAVDAGAVAGGHEIGGTGPTSSRNRRSFPFVRPS